MLGVLTFLGLQPTLYNRKLVAHDIIKLMRMGTKQSVKHNRKFKQIDLKIQAVAQKLLKTKPGNIPVKQVTDAVGITRQGFYHHYSSVDEAIIKGGDKLVEECIKYVETRLQERKLGRSNPNRLIFQNLLLYMTKYKQVFTQICTEPSNHHLLKQILEAIYPMLQITWLPAGQAAPEPGSKRANQYIALAVEIISEWGEQCCCEIESADICARRLISLTDNASSRCKD